MWVLIIGAVSILWVSGAWLFARSALALRTKILWTLSLIAAGVIVGVLLPLHAIGIRFVILLAVMPLLAVADIKLARSNRTFSFWLRACSFEICTVFAVAALTRFALTRW